MTSAEITSSIDAGRYETARRLCRQALTTANGAERNSLLLGLHTACRFLGDPDACAEALSQVESEGTDERLEVLLRRAEDCKLFGTHSFWRTSEDQRQGYSHGEYSERMKKRSLDILGEAEALPLSEQQRKRVSDTARFCKGRHGDPWRGLIKAPASPVRTGACGLTGRIVFEDGAPARNATVTLGLEVATLPPDATRYTKTHLEVYEPDHSALETLRAETDADGRYNFDRVPAGTHEFLSVNLNPQAFPIAVRFLAHGIELRDGDTRELDAVIAEWGSAGPRPVAASLPEKIERHGRRLRLAAVDKLLNPFDYVFPRQLLELELPEGTASDAAKLMVITSDHPDTPLPFQVEGRSVLYFTDLPALHDRFVGVYEVYEANGPLEPSEAMADSPLKLLPADDGSAVVETGRAAFRVPFGEGEDLLAPILQVNGPDGIWRGRGRMHLPAGTTLVARSTVVVERGPLRMRLSIRYRLSNGMEYRFRLTFHRDEEYVLAHEVSPPLEGAEFVFSLPEFSSGRYFLNYKPEQQKHGITNERQWGSLAPGTRTLGLMKETVSFGVPLECFGLLMGKDSLTEKDCIGVFTIRRGEWIDRAFEKICSGPGPAGYSYEQEWPYPEMIGSSLSMITAETDGDDCFFRFGSFDGERHWGLMASSFDRNDGRFKALSEYAHKNSCPRLQEFKRWRLDYAETLERPAFLVRREQVPELRRRRDDPRFAAVWKRIEAERPNGGGQWGPSSSGAFRALVNADPVLLWNKKRELAAIAGPHARSVLLGRDKSPEYSPVASRPVPPWIEDYDLIASSGVFTPEEERRVRAHHLLMGHMYVQKDFMNWTYNARNANFEADRAHAVLAAGICFRDSPDGRAFIAHARSRIANIIDVYCTPDSGKWYENPACYYLVSVKGWTTQFLHLAQLGLISIDDVPRMKEFLRWGVLLLTPPVPGHREMQNGVPAAARDDIRRIRRIAPIGDHAGVGPALPDTYPLMAACYRKGDPEFAALLRWAYHASGANGDHGNDLLLFAHADEWALTPPTTENRLPSRRLQGFGAVLRGNQGSDRESYLLLKLGPGGYRYHNTEGSVIFFADGQPLLYDGGEAGETWRHSTLSFHDTHTMLAPGHVERLVDFDRIGFVQGVHPHALKPGEPNYLNDTCRPESVAIGLENFQKPDPAVSRALFWVKDDYLVMHDALDLDETIPSHWHLQVVADGSSGDLESGWRFQGRFGVDLQALMVVPKTAGVAVKSSWLRMRHLQVSGEPGVRDYLAVLRPLAADRKEIRARALMTDGVLASMAVSGDGIEDYVFSSREGTDYRDANIRFRGKYAAVIRRPGALTLNLLDGERLVFQETDITSVGPAASLTLEAGRAVLAASGTGRLTIVHQGRQHELEVDGSARMDWPVQ